MNKDSFNKLSLSGQVDYINTQLENDSKTSLNKLCKQIGVARSTVHDRFTKQGFKYDKVKRNYIIITKVIEEPTPSDASISEMQKKIDEMYDWYLLQKGSESPTVLNIEGFEGEAKNRTYKFYPDVLKDFTSYCTSHKEYKVQDIISQALYEFLQKYDNKKKSPK